MPPLADPVVRDKIALALRHRRTDVAWTQKAIEEMLRDLPFDNLTPSFARYIDDVLEAHVKGGGEINQVREISKDRENEFFYEFRITADGQQVYVKAVLSDELDPEPMMYVVSCHPGWR